MADSDAANRRDGARYGVQWTNGHLHRTRRKSILERKYRHTAYGVFARIKRRNQHPDQWQADRHSCSFLHRVYRTLPMERPENRPWLRRMSAHNPKGDFFVGSRMHPFQGGCLCIQTRTGTVYSFGETGSSPDTITYRHAAPHPSAKRESFPGWNAGKHASFPHLGSMEHNLPHV